MWKRIVHHTVAIAVCMTGIGFASAQTLHIATNVAPQAMPDSYSVKQDETLIVSAPGVLENDSDPEGATMSVMMVQTTHAGTLSMNANGSFTYVPNTSYFGSDSFMYKVTDGVNESVTVTAYITVQRFNNKPSTANDQYSTAVNTSINIGAPGVLSNDFDIDGQTLSAVMERAPKYGTASMQPNGSFVYVPESQWNGTAVFWYRASDGLDDSPSTSVSIQVGQANQAPTAGNDAVTVNKNTQTDIFVLQNDSDPEGNLSLLSAPSRSAQSGYVDIGLTSIRYTPRNNFIGTDSFEYVITDGSYRETATVTITVLDTGTDSSSAPVTSSPTTVPSTSQPGESTPGSNSTTNPPPPTANTGTETDTAALTNTLIKGNQQSAVYWVGPDLKRYVFPNEATYKTWFSDWKNIKILAQNTLSTIPLGKNIPYRPGVKLLKIPSAPTVYAVEKGGLLRPVLSEDVAFRMYGSAWATFVDDIPESLFVNYLIGEPITGASQFNVDQVMGTARTLLENYK